MNQIATGTYIAQKRREKNLTQAELAEQLGVSNKTVSKWETGRSMPDYSLIQPLCGALAVTVSELLDGEDRAPDRTAGDDARILDLLRRTQELEDQRTSLYGVMLIVMGLALLAVHDMVGGSTVTDFFSGLLLGLSVSVSLVGVFVTVRGISKK